MVRKAEGAPLRWVDLAIAPTVLVGPITADAFHDALFGTPQGVAIERFISGVRAMADTNMAMRSCDCDSLHKRLLAWEVGEPMFDRVLHSYSPCMLHQTNVSVGTVAKQFGRSLVDGGFAHSKLLRMGHYFVRTVLSVEPVVNEALRIINVAPPPAFGTLGRLLVDMFVPPPCSRKGVPASPEPTAPRCGDALRGCSNVEGEPVQRRARAFLPPVCRL